MEIMRYNMLTLFMILLVTVVTLFVSQIFGTFLSSSLDANHNLIGFFGFSLIMGLLFVLSYPLTMLGVRSDVYFNLILFVLFVITVIGLKKIKFKLKKSDLVVLIVLVLFYVLISIRYTLGEQMGDNVYVFIQVIKNINTSILNNFDLNNGLVFDYQLINPTKSFISFYHFFSFINYYIEKLSRLLHLSYIPAYVVTMWVSNILFYIFSAQIILSIKSIFNIKSKLLFGIIFVFIGLYIGSYYYHITLPHIGMTYLSLTLSATVLVLYEYFQTFNRKTLILIFILLYSMNAYATTGALYVMVFSFGIVSITLFKKNKDAFIQIPLFLVPILHYTLIMKDWPNIGLILLVTYLALSGISLLFYYKEKLQNFVFKYIKLILLLLWIVLVLFSVTQIENYWIKVPDFFIQRSRYDRVQDYFTFSTIGQSLMNLFHYCLIACVFLYKKTRTIGWMLVLFLLFFINPIMRPIVAENIAHYEIYNRIFFVVFNTGTLGMGLVALYGLIKESKWIKFTNVIIGTLIVLLLIPTYMQVTTYFYPTYVPRETDYNPLYKMSDNQIDVLEKMRQIVVIEEMENPLIISQIFGTAMYAPEFVVLGYNVNQQRYGPVYIGQELYEIFYTPAIPADDGPRLNAPVRKTCELLIAQKIDFVLYDKSMAIYDEEIGDYMPISWYIRDCGTFVHENDRYILYRFFWE